MLLLNLILLIAVTFQHPRLFTPAILARNTGDRDGFQFSTALTLEDGRETGDPRLYAVNRTPPLGAHISKPGVTLLRDRVYGVGGSLLGVFGVTLRNTNSCRMFTPADVPIPMSVLFSVVAKPLRLPAG